ncbi:MAG: chemotaxis protein CheA, partial [Deltaproteobacteria bacterium]|nr:chemotaxis protein CheA [Deltaproteobacteria bacterium]
MPRASEMDPESCYLGFEIDFKSNADKKTIEDVFEFVKEDCAINIQPATPPSPSVQVTNLNPQKRGSEGDENCRGRIYPTRSGGLDKSSPYNVGGGLSGEAKFIRIDTGKLDKLINLVGELVISNANINQHANRIKDSALIESLSVMSRLVEDIRDNAMNVRMLPIAETFNRFKRIVRDISRDFDKEIELATKGGETELDKTVIEKIGDPLMHLVRNAADHGIENQDVRIKHGKPA